ncbi:hypothetical protein CHUAL_006822 [Chamberlinius hualienensis]
MSSVITLIMVVLVATANAILLDVITKEDFSKRAVAVIFTTEQDNPEIAEFEQYARDSGVDLTNLRELDPRCLIGN